MNDHSSKAIHHQAAPEFREAEPAHADALAPLVYESAHELLDFMFNGRERAEAALRRLLQQPGGHFGYRFARTMLVNNEVAGVVLGYDKRQLAAQELRGTINLFRVAPPSLWPRLLFRVSRALSGYVPPPRGDAFYINNIAVDERFRGSGLGRRLLDHVVETAQWRGYRCVELDVTVDNHSAIRFYERFGFRRVSESGSTGNAKRYGLPGLQRMRLRSSAGRDSIGNAGQPSSAIVVTDVTGLNAVTVDEVYAPGTVEQSAGVRSFSGCTNQWSRAMTFSVSCRTFTTSIRSIFFTN